LQNSQTIGSAGNLLLVAARQHPGQALPFTLQAQWMKHNG